MTPGYGPRYLLAALCYLTIAVGALVAVFAARGAIPW